MALSDLLDDVMPECKGAPRALVLHQLFRSIDAFLNDSRVYRVWLANITVVAGQTEYTLTPPTGFVVAKVTNVKFNTRPILPEADERHAQQDEEDFGTPECFSVSPDGTILALLPNPGIGGTLSVQVALRPEDESSVFPDWIIREYGDDIANGAKGALLTMANVSWSLPQIGVNYTNQFNAAISKARRESVRGKSRAAQRVPLGTFMGR